MSETGLPMDEFTRACMEACVAETTVRLETVALRVRDAAATAQQILNHLAELHALPSDGDGAL